MIQKINYADKQTGGKFSASDANEIKSTVNSNADVLSENSQSILSLQGGQLGSIKPTDAAPTPARNGNYTFSIGGDKPAWLTVEAGVTEVKAGDVVAVVFTAPSTYSYTHVNVSSDFVTIQELKGTYHLQGNGKLSFSGKSITIPQIRRVNHNGSLDESTQSYTFDLSGDYDYLTIGVDGNVNPNVGELVIAKGTHDFYWQEPVDGSLDILICSDGGYWKSQVPELQSQIDRFYNPAPSDEITDYNMGVNFTGDSSWDSKQAFFNDQKVLKDGYLDTLSVKTSFAGDIYLLVMREGITPGRLMTEVLRITLKVKIGVQNIKGLMVPVKEGDRIALIGANGQSIDGLVESTGIGRFQTDVTDPVTGTFYVTNYSAAKDITFQYEFTVKTARIDEFKDADFQEYKTGVESVLKVDQDPTNYGRFRTEALELPLPRAPHIDSSATTTNSESPSDGYLTEVSVRVHDGGTFVFKVGLLDQYPRFVVSRSFELVLANGLNIIDVSHLNIQIYQGEQIAISCTDTAIDGTGSISYQSNAASIPNEIFYGLNNGIWTKLATTYGGEIILSYKIKEVDTIFATKNEISDLNTRITNQNTEISKLRYVYDGNGFPYKLVVYQGNLLIKSVQYTNVLALGNSLTSHPYIPDIGYYGDGAWAMSSTNKEITTWSTHLQTVLRQKQPTALVTPFNISEWETNYMGVDLAALFAPHLGIEYDLIIMRAGENGTAGSDYEDGVDRLISFLRTNFPAADIILTDMFWHNTQKETAFRAIADKYNYQYVSFGNIDDFCLLGQMTLGVDDVFYPIIHSGVASHCTDVCFFYFANILANYLGYSELSGKHTLNVGSTSTQYAINNLTQIKDGYVSILTYGANAPTIDATGATTSNNIAVTHHDIKATTWINMPSPIPTFVTTFKMPDENVNIIL